ncbi:MAG TPA: integrase, partial [Candidatus Limnocylindria bacterium]|nr:integrase [Candidatus Limnocylindria bacterium]
MVNPASTQSILVDGDLAANVASFARHLRAANLSPKTQKAYLDGLGLLATFLSERGMPTEVAN